MTRDLNLDLTLECHEIVRDVDGLALSSRNRYLSPNERSLAPLICKALNETKAQLEKGDLDPLKAADFFKDFFRAEISFRVEYFALCRRDDLSEIRDPGYSGKAVALTALHLGQTRLIDNVFLDIQFKNAKSGA